MSSLPSRVPPKPSLTVGEIIIAGRHSGVRIYCAPQALNAYKAILDAAKKGNYFSVRFIRGVMALSAGRSHLDNVFVKNGSSLGYGRGAFYVALDGILANFNANDDGTFTLTKMQINPSYYGTAGIKNKTGLYRVEKSARDSWKASYITNGSVSDTRADRVVVIADRGYGDVDAAINKSVRGVEEASDVLRTNIQSHGFDLHYTEGDKKIAGLTNAREAWWPESAPSLRVSAQLLAGTMDQASNIDSIYWFSDRGGSGVLTQGMHRLRARNIKLDKHSIIMNRPTTRPSKAEALARELRLNPVKGGLRTINLRELTGRMLVIDPILGAMQKARFGKKYSGKELATEAFENAIGVTDFAAGAIGALGVAGLVAVSAPISVSMGVVGGGIFAYKLLQKMYRSR